MTVTTPEGMSSPDWRAELTRALARYAPAVRLAARGRWLLVVFGAVISALSTAPMFSDPIRFAAAGAQLLRGQFATVYADPWMQAGPFEILGSWLMLPLPHQHTADYIWRSDGHLMAVHLVIGALMVAGPMLAVRRVRRAHGMTGSPALELAAGAAAVVTQLPVWVWPGGHLAQLAIPFMWLWAGSLVVRGRTVRAAAVIGLSAGWEPWGVLAAGILLADPRLRPRWTGRDARAVWAVRDLLGGLGRPARLGAVLGSVLVAAAVAPYLPFVLTGHFELFGLAWPIGRDTLVHALWPDATRFGYGLRLLQGSAAVLAGAAVAAGLGRRAATVWLGPLAVVVVRLLLDPLSLTHYWVPFLALAIIGTGLLSPVRSWSGAGVVAGAVLLVWLPSLHLNQDIALASGWAVLPPALVLIAILVGLIRRAEPLAGPGPGGPAA